MAEIAPFRGQRYNQDKIPDLAQVVIPPYDVISPEEQKVFHEKNPYNFIRLELGLPAPEDSAQDNPHTRAAAFIRQWADQAILIRNPDPSIYYSELDFKDGTGASWTRKGFICALRLEDFSSGRVLPHERTFQAIKDERLALMLACNANLSPIFALYPDSNEKVLHVLASGRPSEPAIRFTDFAGMTHRVWPVTDRPVNEQVHDLMLDKSIFIADGHHRYETALNYRNVFRQRHGAGNPHASYEYVMVYLTDMDEPGLTILPTHRLLRNLGAWDPERFIEKAKSCFEVQRFEPENGGEIRWKDAIGAGGLKKDITIGFYCREGRCIYALTAKREAVSSFLASRKTPDPLRTLDVVVLDQILLRHILGVSDQFLANERNISFRHDFAKALEEIKSGRYDAGFFINHTRIEQVREIACAGLIMPHKSTYFYPKVTSGLVMNLIYPDEEIF
ncbi:MAG: DUF1015 domain-containing protein [Syntrophobacteraceae bacterium]|jgi:uncharacterized protein (DUF1015 family)